MRGYLKRAPTLFASSIVTVQVNAVPVHAPVQPPNSQPAGATGESASA